MLYTHGNSNPLNLEFDTISNVYVSLETGAHVVHRDWVSARVSRSATMKAGQRRRGREQPVGR